MTTQERNQEWQDLMRDVGIFKGNVITHTPTDEEWDEILPAIRRVLANAFGTQPRHTRARDGSCRDDCIPCGLEALARALQRKPA